MPKLPDLIGAVVDDAATLASLASGIPIPGGATAGALVASYLRRRDEQAREIVLEELKAGLVDTFEAASQDDAIAITLRIIRAAREGAAHLNLRLMAKVVAGQARRGALVADEFLPYADMLSSLSRDEIILLGTMYKYWLAAKEHRQRNPGLEPGDPWALTKSELNRNVFRKEGYAEAVAGRTLRSGLLTAHNVYGGIAFDVSPIFIELSSLVDFHDALRREGIGVA